MTKKRSKFVGPLSTPIAGNGAIARTSLGDFRSAAEVERQKHEEWSRLIREKIQKLPLLRDHYSIPDVEIWPWLLLLRLAEETAPGFRVDWGDKPRGRKRKWTDNRYTHLLADIALLKSEDEGRNDVDCIRLLLKQSRFKERWGAETERSLQSRLHEARNGKCNIWAALMPFGDSDHRAQVTDFLVKQFSVLAKHPAFPFGS